MKTTRKHGRKQTSLLPKTLGLAAVALAMAGFSHPLRSEKAANQEAPLLASAPAPQSNPTAPFGAGVMAVGVATLAASRRKD